MSLIQEPLAAPLTAQPKDRVEAEKPFIPTRTAKDTTLQAGFALAAVDAALLLFLIAPSGWAVVFAAAILSLYALAGLYPGFGLMSAERLRRRWLLGLPFLALAVLHSSTAMLGVCIYLLAAPLAEAATRHILHASGQWGKPVRTTGNIAEMLNQNWYLGLIPSAKASTLVLAQGARLAPVEKNGRTDIFLARQGGQVRQVYPEPNRLVAWLGPVPRQDITAAHFHKAKRLIDVVISSGLLILFAPLMGLCMLAICLIDPGPVIYAQFRRSHDGNPVKIYKLRSMYEDSTLRLEHILQADAAAARSWASKFKLQPDPRILPVIGTFMRRFSIDELPQLINVLRGEMSLVGPRIFVDYDLAVYPPDLLQLRQSVPAGLTGLWQVSVRSSGDNADKVRYDTAYVKTWSLWQDVDILYRTVGAVLTGRGAS